MPKRRLEPTVAVPNGGVARRCQAVKKDGQQCKRVARTGYDVCPMHGAGTAKREAEGTRRPPGRPPVHGLYSKRAKETLASLLETVYETEGALESSDRDLAALKATMWFLRDRLDDYLPKLELFEAAVEGLEAVLGKYVVVKDDGEGRGVGEMSAEDAREIAKGLLSAQRILSSFEALLRLLADVQTKTIAAHKLRAETAAKLAETKAHEAFLKLAQLNRAIIHELAPDSDFLDAYEDRIRRELFAPLRLEPPADPTLHPRDLN